MPKRLVIIDGKSVFYRGYYAMPSLATKEGQPTGGVYGFTALALEVFKKLKPDYVAVAWDKPKTNIRARKKIYPDYKAGRKPAPPDFYEQIPILHELLEAFSWPLYELDDYEADDIMGTFALQASKQGIETCMITSDLDVLQCVGPLTHVYAMKKGFTDIKLYNPETFEEKYGIRVDQFIDLKSLKGDSSDNIPGVPGIGEKGAIQLLQDYQTLDGIYEHLADIKDSMRKKLEAGKESAYMSKQIAEIWCDAPIKLELDKMDTTDLDADKLKKLLTRLEFRSLLKNLPEHMQAVEVVEETAERPKMSPATLKKFDQAAQVAITMNPAVAVTQKDEKTALISAKSGEAYEVSLKDFGKVLKGTQILAHNSKALLKNVLKAGNEDIPGVAHDTEQGAFLLDPLSKFRELGDLAGHNVDEPLSAIEALWQVYAEQAKQLEKLPKLAKVAREIDFALIPVLAHMEHRGIILNCKSLEKMQKELAKEIEAIKKEMYEMVGYEFNISSPAQLADVLFGKLQLPTAGIKKGKTGFSTGQKELNKLRGQHPIIEKIEEYRERTKLQNTYVEALPKQVDENSRLHTDFRQDVAATGRLSSAFPNLQNIPIRTELGRKIREAFEPAKGNVFINADYSQFELRLAAAITGDENMIKAFNNDADIHTETAVQLYGIKPEDVTKAQRSSVKAVNFGIMYGLGPHALSESTEMSFGEAKDFIARYFEIRPKLKEYIEKTRELANEQGYVETLLGRRRPTPDVKSSNFMVREGAYRAAINMPLQGSAADIMKMAMIEIDKKLDKESVQVLQIHDSVLVECPAAKAEAVGKILKDTMENVYPKLAIKLKVDISIGKNWGEL